jgi:hypothetical protein
MPAEKARNAFAAETSAPFDTIFAFNRGAFESWARNMSKLSQEMGQFMQSRLKEEAAMWEKLAGCRDASELLQCQGEFAAKTGSDYAEAAQKLSRLMLDFANNSLKPTRAPETD